MSNLEMQIRLLGDSLERIADVLEIALDKKKHALRKVYKTHLGQRLAVSEPNKKS